MKNYYISRSEILSLYSNSLQKISIQNISMWLKSETNNQFIVIEKKFILEAIDYIEYNRYSDQFLGHDFKERWDLERIKKLI